MNRPARHADAADAPRWCDETRHVSRARPAAYTNWADRALDPHRTA